MYIHIMNMSSPGAPSAGSLQRHEHAEQRTTETRAVEVAERSG